MHGKVKAGTQFFHLLDSLQALRGLFGQTLCIWHHQVGVGLVVAAPDATAQLVQLSQAKLVGAAHDDGVGAGYVNPSFNDGGAEQHIETLGHKVTHDAFKFTLWHLTMRHGNSCFWQQFFKSCTAVFDGVDFVV